MYVCIKTKMVEGQLCDVFKLQKKGQYTVCNGFTCKGKEIFVLIGGGLGGQEIMERGAVRFFGYIR